MTISKLALIASTMMITSSMYGMITKQLSPTRTSNPKQKWNNVKPANGNPSRDPKIFEKELSQPVRYPDPIISRQLLHFTYGSGAIKSNAVVHFEQAQKIAAQAQKTGKPLPIGPIYDCSHEEQNAIKIILNGLEESSDKTKMQVSPKQWRQLGSDTPLIARLVFGDVKVGLPMTADQQMAHLVITSIKYAAIGAGGAAAISLANNTCHNAIEETTKALWDNKISIAKKAAQISFNAITENATKAFDAGLDDATKKLNNTDYAKVGTHCYAESFPEDPFFPNVAKQAGKILQDELESVSLHYKIELAKQFAPGAAFKTSNIEIDPKTVVYGGVAGLGVGLGVGIYTMNDNIQEERLLDIHCTRRT